jgi:hypothetical protein
MFYDTDPWTKPKKLISLKTSLEDVNKRGFYALTNPTSLD